MASNGGLQEQVHLKLRDAYSIWVNTMEAEVMDKTATSTDGRRLKRRGRFPNIKEVDVVHTVRQQSDARRLATAWTKLLCALGVLAFEESETTALPRPEVPEDFVSLDQDLEWTSTAVVSLVKR